MFQLQLDLLYNLSVVVEKFYPEIWFPLHPSVLLVLTVSTVTAIPDIFLLSEGRTSNKDAILYTMNTEFLQPRYMVDLSA